MKLSALTIFITFLLYLPGMGGIMLFSQSKKAISESSESQKELISSCNQFGFKIFGEIVKSQENSNIFISPFSISMALGMVYNGASGSTYDAMQKTLELSGVSGLEMNKSYQHLTEYLLSLDPEVKLQIANSLWYRQRFSFEKEFRSTLEKYFNAIVKGVNFDSPATISQINNWVDSNTNGKIKEIISSIDPSTMMILINAIYFKGIWTEEFDKKKTMNDRFTLPDGSTTPCKMMMQKGDFNYFENEDFQAIDLPYGDGKFGMTIVLPRPGNSINKLAMNLSQQKWDDWTANLAKQKGTIQLPRFKLEYELMLNDVLAALGMGIAFEPQKADFTGISKSGDLYLSKVLHKTFVEVNEEGTEAAAATSVIVGITSVKPAGFVMRVDRPFLFIIRERGSGSILFAGTVVNPQSE